VSGLQEIVLRFKFHQNWSSSFRAVGRSKFALSLIWQLAWTKS